MLRRRWLVIVGLLGLVLSGQAVGKGEPVDRSGLATGPYSVLHALMEATLFKIDVLTVDLTVDRPTRDALRKIAAGKAYTPDREEQIVRSVLHVGDSLVEVRFLRDVDLSDFLSEAEKQLTLAAKASLISRDERDAGVRRLRSFFRGLVERGFEDGDQLLYRARSDSLRMVLLTAKGKMLADERIPGARSGVIVLASYLAPQTTFREPLVRSLFE
jgi:hypothetical protein